MEHIAERRQFWRAAFHAQARLVSGSLDAQVEVLDLSLNGALVELPVDWPATVGAEGELRLSLGEDVAIVMQVMLVHLDASRAGLRCTHIDLDSITHLRRLVELNSGDPAQLDRELAKLLH